MGVPVIRSPNPEVTQPITEPTSQFDYPHPLQGRRGMPIPVAFQITSPFDRRTVLLPHMLVMHVNPQNFNENHTKKIERIQTRGGFVEQHWGDELSEVSADGSTGAFVNLYTGLSSVLRQQTIAWDRYQDLYDLFHNNGSVHDPNGNIVLQGNVMLLYDKGTYLGYFRAFDVEETADSPFAFKVNWTFKVQEVILRIPGFVQNRGRQAPIFQTLNLRGSSLQTTEAAVEEKETPDETQQRQTEERAQQEALFEQARLDRLQEEITQERLAEEAAAAEAAAAATQQRKAKGR